MSSPTLAQLRQMRGVDPALIASNEKRISSVINTMLAGSVYLYEDDDGSLQEFDSDLDSEFSDGGGAVHQALVPPPRVSFATVVEATATQRRQPITINYDEEDELEDAVIHYTLLDAEENTIRSNRPSWWYDRTATPPDDAVTAAVQEVVIAFTRDAQPCVICLEPMQLGDRVGQIRCGHKFCCKCVKAWLRKSAATSVPRCPLCRAKIALDVSQSSIVRSNSNSSQRSTPTSAGRRSRWQQLAEDEEAELEAALARERCLREQNDTTTTTTILRAPVAVVAPPAPKPGRDSLSLPSLGDLEKRSAWLHEYMTARRREDERLNGGAQVPLPRVATLLPKKSPSVGPAPPPPLVSPKSSATTSQPTPRRATNQQLVTSPLAQRPTSRHLHAPAGRRTRPGSLHR